MKRFGMAVAVAMMLVPLSVAAQDSTQTIVFGAYYRCDAAQETRADEIVQQVRGPIAQQYVGEGLTGWLWLTHRQGGDWRRLWVVSGTDINAMMDVNGKIHEEFMATQEWKELTAICPSHDDYIWTSIATSPANPDAPAGPASLSAYYACDQSRAGRADEIFESVLAPLYQKHTDMGHLTSWGFYAHRFGGIFRRLETFSGADHQTLLAMQDAIYTEAGENNALAMNEFREICSWHTDYMWINASQP